MAKSKRTDENRAAILEGIEAGLSDKKVLDAVGITYPTFYAWMDNDPSFSEDVQRARGGSKQNLLRELIEIATLPIARMCGFDGMVVMKPSDLATLAPILNTKAKTAEWILSRRWPNDFSEKRVIEAQTGTDPFALMVQMYDDEEQAQQGDTPANEGDSE